MKEFRQLLKAFSEIYEILSPLTDLGPNLKSERLQALTNCEDTNENGLLPTNIIEINKKFDEMIVWRRCQAGNSSVEVAEPRPGIDQAYDNANETVNATKDELE